jgi:integrase
MTEPTVSADLQKRHRSERYRGIYYRLRADGTRSYSVYFQGKFVPAGRTEREALEKQADLRGKQARGERVLLPKKVTFAEVAEEWYTVKSARLRPWTLRGYRDSLDLVLAPRFGGWKLSAIDADAIAKLTRDLERDGLHAIDSRRPKRPLSPASIGNHLGVLRGVLAFGVRRGYTASNPFDHLTTDDRPHSREKQPAHEWSDEEVEALLEASRQLAAAPEARYDYSTLLLLTARLGLRLGEVLGLKWADFDKDDGTLTVCRQWTRLGEYAELKTPAARRRIPLSPEIRDELIAHRLRSGYSGNEDPIFASRTGTPLTHRNVTRRGFEAAAKKAGVEGVSFHKLRHAAASRLIEAGLSPVVVARILGHSDATVTLRVYAHLFDRERTDEAVRRALEGIG